MFDPKKKKNAPIVIIGDVIFQKCGHEHPKHHFSSYFSTIIYNNLTVTGKIMATTFKKSEQVFYVIAFVDANGNPAEIQPGSLSIGSSDNNIAVVEKDSTNQLKGVVKGVNDGTCTISWSGTSIGGATISGTADIEIADIVPQPEAVSTSIQFSAPQPQ